MTRYAHKAVRPDDERLVLTDEQVRALRVFRQIQKLCDVVSSKTLADELGCSKGHIQRIWQGRKRKDVQAPKVSLQTLLGLSGCASALTGPAATTNSPQIGSTNSWSGLINASALSKTEQNGRG
jgi:hypothetical protein